MYVSTVYPDNELEITRSGTVIRDNVMWRLCCVYDRHYDEEGATEGKGNKAQLV